MLKCVHRGDPEGSVPLLIVPLQPWPAKSNPSHCPLSSLVLSPVISATMPFQDHANRPSSSQTRSAITHPDVFVSYLSRSPLMHASSLEASLLTGLCLLSLTSRLTAAQRAASCSTSSTQCAPSLPAISASSPPARTATATRSRTSTASYPMCVYCRAQAPAVLQSDMRAQFMIQGGDIVEGNGTTGRSIYGPTFTGESIWQRRSHRTRPLIPPPPITLLPTLLLSHHLIPLLPALAPCPDAGARTTPDSDIRTTPIYTYIHPPTVARPDRPSGPRSQTRTSACATTAPGCSPWPIADRTQIHLRHVLSRSRGHSLSPSVCKFGLYWRVL